MRKKILAFLLTVVSVFMLAGCTNGDITLETQKTKNDIYVAINNYAISQNRFFDLYEAKKGFEEQTVYLDAIKEIQEITNNQLRLFPAIELFRIDDTEAFYDITNGKEVGGKNVNGFLSLNKGQTPGVINGTLNGEEITYTITSTYNNNVYIYEVETKIDNITSYSTVTFKPNLSYIKVKQGAAKDATNDFYIFECYLLKNNYMLTRINKSYSSSGKNTIDMVANNVGGRLKVAQVGNSILIEDFSSISSSNFATITQEDKSTPARKKYAYEMKNGKVDATKV